MHDYFSIGFTGTQATDENGRTYAVGQIRFGFNSQPETIAAYLNRWAEDRYVEQWKQGIRRISETGGTASCLIVSVQPYEYGGAIECWEMHKEGPRVSFRYVIHAPLLSGDQEMVDPDRIYDRIASRYDFEDASEWHVGIGALVSCLHRLSQ